jgi:hypothetical protein
MRLFRTLAFVIAAGALVAPAAVPAAQQPDLLYVCVQLYRACWPKGNRRVGLPAPYKDTRSSIHQFNRIVGRG